MLIDMTELEMNNLLAFLTGKERVKLTGDEAFAFTAIVNKLAAAKPHVVSEPEAKPAEVEKDGDIEALCEE